jgi:1,4-alpha-glucan branching enzyme
MAAGAFCLVLHGHLPWVLHHGRWPHGEDWLFEAATETWLPLLGVLDVLAEEGISPGWTVGLTPVLLEQLAHPRFTTGLIAWLGEQIERARSDAADFRRRSDPHLGWLADRHAAHLKGQRERFESLGRDLPGALAAHVRSGAIGLLTSNATHGYHPLMLHDACARAQVRAGVATTTSRMGITPTAAWLPECAYRSAGPWTPIALHGDQRDRVGVASLFADEGIQCFFVDTHLVAGAVARAVLDGDSMHPVLPGQADWDTGLAWRSELEPHRVVEGDALTGVTVLARCPDVSEQVWSGKVGYPGNPAFLEFHKRHGYRGLHYWKITGPEVSLGEKDPYYPDDVASVVAEQADHFVAIVRRRLEDHRAAVGRYGIVCAPFDAELFGHWWHEGPLFLLEVARRMHHDPAIDAITAQAALERAPADKAVSLPEGTWGAGGDHRVWLNAELNTYWEVAYRCEDRFLDLWHRAPWRTDSAARELLTEAGRQLLLVQASDWPFVISTRGAVDYGTRRFHDHAARLDDLCNGVEDRIRAPDAAADPVVLNTLARCRLLDPVFPDLDLEWWT